MVHRLWLCTNTVQTSSHSMTEPYESSPPRFSMTLRTRALYHSSLRRVTRGWDANPDSPKNDPGNAVVGRYPAFTVMPHVCSIAPPFPKQNHKPTSSEIERLKASRRAALARIAFQRQQETSRREELERTEREQEQQRRAETRARASTMRCTAVSRAAMAAAEIRRRERERLDAQETQTAGKMERLAALMTTKDEEILDRERRVRTETCLRIRRERIRRELAERQRNEEQAERLRRYEARRYSVSVPPAPESCRSFFPMTEEAVRTAYMCTVVVSCGDA